MDPVERPVELYDFLYKDLERINSYYAQIFSGRLTRLVESDAERRSSRTSESVSASDQTSQILESQNDQVQAESRRIVDPHDLIVTDVLSFINRNNMVSTDLEDSPNHSLVIAKGTLFLSSKETLQVAINAFGANLVPQEYVNGPIDETAVGLGIASILINNTGLPSSYKLLTEDGFVVVGTIKDEGMDQPVPFFQYQYGGGGIEDIYLLGIKENKVEFHEDGNAQTLLEYSRELATAMSDALLDRSAIRVNPIAFFRKIA